MGIARFYRWLSERYPLINEVIDVDNVPEFDNLYLDMNGIIHHCSHGNTGGRKQASEDHMWLDVFKYVSGLVYRIKPQKLLYLAVDGVAPRAKMNQQRSRRFRAAHDAKESRERSAKIKEAERSGQVSSAGFDSNCITPGTEFMERLVHHLEFFVKKKIAEDPLWKNLKVVLSGPDVPGEGEHKIMDFIRAEKSQPDFDPNTRHCLYGLDADLIMLSLASHEPYFALLREEIDFGFSKTKSKENRSMVKPDKFQLLHVGVLREYLALDFLGERYLSEEGNPKSDVLLLLDRIIDDFIMFCFLVGNDFLPHLPFSEIGEGGLNKLFSCYKELMVAKADNHFLVTSEGEIDYGNLFLFLTHYVKIENGVVEELISNKNWKIGQTRTCDSSQPPPSSELYVSDAADEWSTVLPAATAKNSSTRVSTEIPSTVEAAREQYYEIKLGIVVSEEGADARMKKLVLSYLQGLQWVYLYYFKGPPSWDWYYPYHYAPFAVDVVAVLQLHFDQGKNLKIGFEQGKPFLPFQQLMAVLPPASGEHLLPKSLYQLMVDPRSPIKDCYPEIFQIDVDGVKVPWGGVTIIPFVDEKKLLKAINETISRGGLTNTEMKRNTLGQAQLFQSAAGGSVVPLITSATSSIPNLVKDVSNCSIILEPFVHSPLPVGLSIFPHRVLEGYSAKVHPDFPSLFKFTDKFSIDFSYGSGVKVFNSVSKQESIFLSLSMKGEVDVQPILPDERISVNFPFYSKQFTLFAVSDANSRVKQVKGRAVTEVSDARKHEGNVHWLVNKLEESGLILDVDSHHPVVELVPDINASHEIVKALACMTMVKKKRLARLAPQSSSGQSGSFPAISLNTKNELIFGRPFKVEEGKAVFNALPSLDFTRCVYSALVEITKLNKTTKFIQWMSASDIARNLDLSEDQVWTIFGEVWIRHGRAQEEVGMNLWSYASTGEPQCVANLSKFVPTYKRQGRLIWNRWDMPNRQEWTFSSKSVNFLKQYMADFPQLFAELREAIDNSNSATINNGGVTLQGKRLFSRFQRPEDVSSGGRDDWVSDFYLNKLVNYVNASTWKNSSICSWTYEALGEESVQILAQFLEEFKSISSVELVETMNLDSAFGMSPQTLLSSATDPMLGQRGIYVKQNGLVPVGSWGTVIGIYGKNESSSRRIDLLLDEDNMNGSSLNGICSEMRGLRIPPADWRAARDWGLVSEVQDANLKASKNRILANLIVRKEKPAILPVQGIKISVDDLFGKSQRKERPLPPTALLSLPQELTEIGAPPPPKIPEFLLSKLRRNPDRNL